MKRKLIMDKNTENRVLKEMSVPNEKQRRRYLAIEAQSLGHGGITAPSKLTCVSRMTISGGIRELADRQSVGANSIRRDGGGRKLIREKNPEIVEEILKIADAHTIGNPEKPLSYATQSAGKIEKILKEKGYEITSDTIRSILKKNNYSLRLNQKMRRVGEPHPDGNSLFEFINKKSMEFTDMGEPVISIDSKKKEKVGNFKNDGRIHRQEKKPTEVSDHDFPLMELGKVTPYGVYDIDNDEGFVCLGKDTAEFAVEGIARRYLTLGRNAYPYAAKIRIDCDGGGGNGSENRLFKLQLRESAVQSGLERISFSSGNE
jgi:hypothetical protein